MKIILTPTRSCPEYKHNQNGWELTEDKPFGFRSALGQPPSRLKNANWHYLGWVWMPREYWLAVTRSGDEVNVDGFGRYGYGILRGGFEDEDTGELKGRKSLNENDVFYVDPPEPRNIRFKLRYEK